MTTSERLPDFIIVGAMKAGTTTLADLLKRHPSIYMPEGESHFFDDENRYENEGLASYRAEFSGATADQLIGEKTPTYSSDPRIPARIAQHCPGARILWLFRDPAARAFSHYLHAIGRGHETQTFEQAIEEDEVRQIHRPHLAYVHRGIYHLQVERYLTHFSPEQMLYLDFHELSENPERTVERALAFLGITDQGNRRSDPIHSNRAKEFRSLDVQRLINRLDETSLVWRKLSAINRTEDRSKRPRLSEKLRKRLNVFFETPNEKLRELTGIDLNVRISGA